MAKKTKQNSNYNIRLVIVAAIIAGFIIFIAGSGYRVLAAQLSSPVATKVLSEEALAKLPLQIGDWTGQDVALDEDIIRATDTDALINRRYIRQNALGSIGLYIAYGARARDLMPHRPEVCYTGAGWTLVDRLSMDLTLNEQVKLPCRILQFKRGTLKTEKTIVLNYYIVDGQLSGDVSLLRSKAWRGSGTIKYVAQVQIVASVTSNQAADSIISSISDFAIESTPFIIRLFESVERNEKTRTEEDGMIGEKEG